jgi:REP element-mobilizing transposase RayT
MPREARKISRSNIYHVILRGINRQDIFEDDGDRHYFMTVMQHYKGISDFRLHAFCLMTNHVHLLMEPKGEPLGQVFRRVGVRYVSWYNRKYERTGHLFQDRFRSETVESDAYYRSVLRYILQNPMKAGMERSPGNWRWSSYLAYQKGTGSITDTQYALNVFGGRDALLDFVQQGNDDLVMDEDRYDWRVRDDRAKQIMERLTECSTVAEFQELEKRQRKEYVKELYQRGIAPGQIVRLTGVPRASIYRIVEGIRVVDSAEIPELREPVLFEPGEFVYSEGDGVIW